jgi:DNA-binding CsgD family transcriptional regulator
MVTLEAFSDLLEVLYSAPLQQEQWQNFLTLLSGHTQSTTGFFVCADARLGLSIHALGGTQQSPQTIQGYNEQYGKSDPFRTPALRLARTGVFQDEQLLPGEGFTQTDLYRNLLGPAGLRYATVLLLTASIRRLEAISIWRTHEQGSMPPDSIRLLELLVPHVQMALEIRQVLGVAQRKLAGAEAMADASATATFLLTRHGRVLHSNAAAECLLRQGDALILRDGMLVTTQVRFKEPLRKLLHDAASPVSPHWKDKPAHALSLHRPSSQQPLQLLASPLPPAHRNPSNADLVLLVTDPEKPVNFPDDVLHSLYGLTPAQTEIANGLLTGYTLEEIACLRRTSVGTVRQQLKSIMNKTGTNRQSDLVRLLMTLPQSASAN